MIIKSIIIIAHAFVGWGLCGAIVGIGRNVTSMRITLIVHAIGAPVIFAVLSVIYFKWFHYTTAFQTANVFVLFVIFTAQPFDLRFNSIYKTDSESVLPPFEGDQRHRR